MEFNSTYLTSILAATGIEAEPPQIQMLDAYAELLLFWNEKVNLISRKDEEAVWRNHILHSLAGLTVMDFDNGDCVLDIGTGGGLPGIPLAILRPDTEFVLCDSIGKKIRAVENMVESIGLQNVRCITARVEDLIRRYPGGAAFDACVTRAVAPLDELARWCAPLMKPGASLAAWKGGDLGAEIEACNRGNKGIAVTRRDIILEGEEYFQKENKCIVVVQW